MQCDKSSIHNFSVVFPIIIILLLLKGMNQFHIVIVHEIDS